MCNLAIVRLRLRYEKMHRGISTAINPRIPELRQILPALSNQWVYGQANSLEYEVWNVQQYTEESSHDPSLEIGQL